MIDPIDGTRSFITGQLHWATLIALNDGARVVAGVIHQPYVGRDVPRRRRRPGRVAARRGEAPARHPPLRAARRRDRRLHDARHVRHRAGARRIRPRRANASRLVRYGGDCYAYALLAAGLMDVVIESSLQAYDVQALIPVIEGAGGVITSWTGGRCDEGGDVVACGDPRLHAEVLRVLGERGA